MCGPVPLSLRSLSRLELLRLSRRLRWGHLALGGDVWLCVGLWLGCRRRAVSRRLLRGLSGDGSRSRSRASFLRDLRLGFDVDAPAREPRREAGVLALFADRER